MAQGRNDARPSRKHTGAHAIAAKRNPPPLFFVTIALERGVAGVAYALQRGRSEIEQAQVARLGTLRFNFPVTLATAADGTPDVKGKHVQGKPGDRFVYITVGTRAGQADSPWDRRIKVPLRGIDKVTRTGAAQARIAGTARDGTPSSASVLLLDGGWVAA